MTADPYTREYSHRLGVLTGAQLQAALDRFDLGALVDARPAPGGLFGQNVLLTTTSGGWVLRGCPHYDGQFEKERFFSRVVHERSEADAPWPFLIERSQDIFGWSFALMPLIEGVQLSDPDVQRALTPEDHDAIAAAMGDYVRRVQSAAWAAPAVYDYDGDGLAPLDASYADWWIARMRDQLTTCRERPATTTDDDVAWVESMIAAACPALDLPFAPVVVHTDFAEGNVVGARTQDGGWEMRGIFDLGSAYVGDGEYDLARLTCWYGRQSEQRLAKFLRARYAAEPPRSRFAERLALYILADRMVFWEYGHRNNVWFTRPDSPKTLRAWAEPFLALTGPAAAAASASPR